MNLPPAARSIFSQLQRVMGYSPRGSSLSDPPLGLRVYCGAPLLARRHQQILEFRVLLNEGADEWALRHDLEALCANDFERATRER